MNRASGWTSTATAPSSSRPDSALIETSEAPQIKPAAAPSSAPPRGLSLASLATSSPPAPASPA